MWVIVKQPAHKTFAYNKMPVIVPVKAVSKFLWCKLFIQSDQLLFFVDVIDSETLHIFFKFLLLIKI